MLLPYLLHLGPLEISHARGIQDSPGVLGCRSATRLAGINAGSLCVLLVSQSFLLSCCPLPFAAPGAICFLFPVLARAPLQVGLKTLLLYMWVKLGNVQS